MRRVVTWFVDALPFDMRSRRAIAETLADWAHEAREQHGVLQRIGVDILSAISVARVASLALVREAGDFDWTHGLARRARVVACIAVAIGVTFGLLTLSALGSWAWLAGFAMVPASLIAAAAAGDHSHDRVASSEHSHRAERRNCLLRCARDAVLCLRGHADVQRPNGNRHDRRAEGDGASCGDRSE